MKIGKSFQSNSWKIMSFLIRKREKLNQGFPCNWT